MKIKSAHSFPSFSAVKLTAPLQHYYLAITIMRGNGAVAFIKALEYALSEEGERRDEAKG